MELAAKQNRVTTVPKKTNSFFPKKAEPSFFAPVFIQPTLMIGPVDDPYEREADAVADKVMRMPETSTSTLAPLFSGSEPISTIQRHCAACETEDKLQRKEEEEEDLIQSKADKQIQRMCSSCEEEEAKVQPKLRVQRRCAECEEEEHNSIQPKTDHSIQLRSMNDSVQRQCAACEKEENISRKESASMASPVATPSVHSALNAPGQSLDKSTRSFMESRFGYDFSNVRIHNDVLAHTSSKDINALAYTHGDHVVFAAGQYQPHTIAGKQLLAHELTHVVQQNKDPVLKAQRSLLQRAPGPPLYSAAVPSVITPPDITIDIRGATTLKLDEDLGEYLDACFIQNIPAPVKIKYGDAGVGFILLEPQSTWMRTKECTTTRYPTSVISIVLPDIVVEDCHYLFDTTKNTCNAKPQVIPFELSGLDTSDRDGTLVLKIQIQSNEISGELGWVNGKTKNNLQPSDFQSKDFEQEVFLPLIFGNDYTGQGFRTFDYVHELIDGYLVFDSASDFKLPNQQQMGGFIKLGDKGEHWAGEIETNIIGANNYPLPINRTQKGQISGEGDGVTINKEWGDKKIDELTANLHASFVNSKLFVVGKANYKSERAEGELFLAVTDYATAKKYANEYLPDDIAALANADKTYDKTEKLAFVGAGKLKLILFDGKKNTKPAGKSAAKSLIPRKDSKDQPDRTLVADASFVVEPDGYITVAGQIKQPAAEYKLFEEMSYEKNIKFHDIPLGIIFGPWGSSFELVLRIGVDFGAKVGPLKLSQLSISGLYSNRPGANKELELSAFLELQGKVFATLWADLDVDINAGPFTIADINLIGIKFGAEMSGSVSGRPTITIRSTDKDPDKPREYFIKGNFDYAAAGKLSYGLSDLFRFDAVPDPDKVKGRAIDTQKYIPGEEKKDKNADGRDVEIPMDHSLGSGEPPNNVSVDRFTKMNFGTALKNIITGRGVKDYFAEGYSSSSKNPAVTPVGFNAGQYMEGGQIRGHLGSISKPTSHRKNLPTYVFSKEFHMKGVLHKLYLIADVEQEGGITKSVRQALMMASDNMEELSEKIDEEKTEIKRVTEPTDVFQEKDLRIIEEKQDEIKREVQDLAINGELNENTEIPEMVELAIPLENYSERYQRDDLGTTQTHPTTTPSTPSGPITTPSTPYSPTPDGATSTPDASMPIEEDSIPDASEVTPVPDAATTVPDAATTVPDAANQVPTDQKTQPTPTGIKPCPDMPSDIFPGSEIIFDDYYMDESFVEVTGVVIELIDLKDKAGNTEWHIRFKPKTARETTSWAPRAYKSGCDPAYRRKPTIEECQSKYVKVKTIDVPQRTIGSNTYYKGGRVKASVIMMAPLCWSDYRDPKSEIVGIDRIDQKKEIWHRAHLVHGNLGGEGLFANLVPVPKHTNNDDIPELYERELVTKVVDGHKTGTHYWFRAEVDYHNPKHENYDIHHYDDFVKEIRIFYGEARPKAGTKNEWEYIDRTKVQATITIDYEPSYADLKSTRTEG